MELSVVHKILIKKNVSDVGKQYLLDRNYEVISGLSEDMIKKEIKDCDAILARTEAYPTELLQTAKKLKVIAKNGVGVDNIDLKKATELGIYITNAPLSNANSVAEHVLGLIIALAKNFLVSDMELRNGNFEIRNQLVNYELEGKKLGIIGYGRIGSLLAKKASKGFGMNVICYDPFVDSHSIIPEVELVNDLERLIKSSDFISLHLPYTPETKGMIGKKYLKMMKNTAYLINSSRGELINEEELTVALQDKTIAGAALDVFEKEPPTIQNPLFKLNNVIVTPHSAALSVEAKDRMALHAAIGIDEVLSGQKPSWPVNRPNTHSTFGL